MLEIIHELIISCPFQLQLCLTRRQLPLPANGSKKTKRLRFEDGDSRRLLTQQHKEEEKRKGCGSV